MNFCLISDNARKSNELFQALVPKLLKPKWCAWSTDVERYRVAFKVKHGRFLEGFVSQELCSETTYVKSKYTLFKCHIFSFQCFWVLTIQLFENYLPMELQRVSENDNDNMKSIFSAKIMYNVIKISINKSVLGKKA